MYVYLINSVYPFFEAAMCEHDSAKPAIQVQCPHSTVPILVMATHGFNGVSFTDYECFTLPLSKKMSPKYVQYPPIN